MLHREARIPKHRDCGPLPCLGEESHPRFAHTLRAGRGLGVRRHGTQMVVEEVGVDIESDRGRLAAEHPLQGLHVGAGGDRERRGRVSKVVRRDPRELVVSGLNYLSAS